MTAKAKLGIVVAMEREIGSLASGWPQSSIKSGGIEWSLRRSNTGVVVIFVGTGYRRAYAGTKVLIESARPEVVTSVGFAGAAVPDMRVGDIFIPSDVLRYSNGQRYQSECGQGLLATLDEVANPEAKSELASGMSVRAVDMEAAGVAQAAQEAGRRFLALKVISDAHSEDLSVVTQFVRPEGFQTGKFVAHIAVRPSLWPTVGRLAVNSSVAARALVASAEKLISDVDGFIERHSSNRLQ